MIRSPGNPRIRMPKVEARATNTTPDPDGWRFNMDGGPAEAERALAHAIELWDREYVRWARAVRALDAVGGQA